MRRNELDLLTEKVIGIAFKIHRALGPGFSEKVYERAMEIEFIEAGLNFKRQKSMSIEYMGRKVGRQQVDFVLEDEVILELKCASKLINIHFYQLLSYLKAGGKQLGLLFNFATKSVEVRRVVNKLYESNQ